MRTEVFFTLPCLLICFCWLFQWWIQPSWMIRSMQYSSIFIMTNYCWDISLHVFYIPLSNLLLFVMILLTEPFLIAFISLSSVLHLFTLLIFTTPDSSNIFLLFNSHFCLYTFIQHFFLNSLLATFLKPVFLILILSIFFNFLFHCFLIS